MSLTEQPEAVDIVPELDAFVDACQNLTKTHQLTSPPAAWNFPTLGGHLRMSNLKSDGRTTGCVIQLEIAAGTLQIMRHGRMMTISLNGRRIEPSAIVGQQGLGLKQLLGALKGALPDAESASSVDRIHRETTDFSLDIQRLLSNVRSSFPQS